MLPGLSGYDVVRTLRAEENWVPVLMLSAKDGEYDQADGLDYGADDYLTKPFSFVVLLARLRALLRRSCPQRPAVLTAGDVQLDPATREVRLADAPVALTPREFALLEYLLRHPDRVVSKTELLDHVWDAAEDTDPNAVEVYVGYLRRKLGRDGPGDRPGRRLPAGSVSGRPARISLRARLMLIGVTGVAAALAIGERGAVRRARPRHRAAPSTAAPGPRRRTSSRWSRQAPCPTRSRCPARRWCRWSTGPAGW